MKSRAAMLILGVSLLAAEVHAQNNANKMGVQPVSQLTVYDAKGAKVGGVVGVGSVALAGSMDVALTVNNRPLVLTVGACCTNPNSNTLPLSGSGVGTLDRFLYFVTPNCTGVPYAQLLSSDLISLMPVTVINAARLYLIDGAFQDTVAFGSYLDFYGGCVPFDYTTYGTPVKFFFDLNTQFTAPFSVH